MTVVDQQEIITIDQLINIVRASRATVRRDVEVLYKNGLLQKTRGGVMSTNHENPVEPCPRKKNDSNIAEKIRIAHAALNYIDAGDRVLLDSGTTMLELARLIKSGTGVTAVTYDLLVAMEIAKHSDVGLMVVGGTLHRSCYSVYGYFAEKMLGDIRVNKAFLSADAIDLKQGVMSYTTDDISLKKMVLQCANEVILLCDHSKFEANAFVNIAGLDIASRIIVGNELSEHTLAKLRETGLIVEVV